MAHRLVALTLALSMSLLVAGPPRVGGIGKPKGGQSAGRFRKVTPPRVAS